MRALLIVVGVAGILHLAATGSQGQDEPLPKCSPARGASRLEEETVQRLVQLWQRETNDTLRRKTASTLQQMAMELAPAFACVLNHEVNMALAEGTGGKRRHETVHMLAEMLGRLGNVVSRETDATKALITIVSLKDRMPPEVRQAAVEALGKIFANRSIFLILDRETFWLRDRMTEPTPRQVAETLMNETATLKEKFNLTKTPSPEEALKLIAETRIAERRIMVYKRVISLLSELEEPQEKDLRARIDLDLKEITNSLLIVATVEKAADRAAAAARAEFHVKALHEEMATVSQNVWSWQDLNQATTDVIATLRGALRDPNPVIRFSSAEALGRIYGKAN